MKFLQQVTVFGFCNQQSVGGLNKVAETLIVKRKYGRDRVLGRTRLFGAIPSDINERVVVPLMESFSAKLGCYTPSNHKGARPGWTRGDVAAVVICQVQGILRLMHKTLKASGKTLQSESRPDIRATSCGNTAADICSNEVAWRQRGSGAAVPTTG